MNTMNLVMFGMDQRDQVMLHPSALRKMLSKCPPPWNDSYLCLYNKGNFCQQKYQSSSWILVSHHQSSDWSTKS